MDEKKTEFGLPYRGEFTRQLIRNGNALGFIIPANVVDQAGLKMYQKVAGQYEITDHEVTFIVRIERGAGC